MRKETWRKFGIFFFGGGEGGNSDYKDTSFILLERFKFVQKFWGKFKQLSEKLRRTVQDLSKWLINFNKIVEKFWRNLFLGNLIKKFLVFNNNNKKRWNNNFQKLTKFGRNYKECQNNSRDFEDNLRKILELFLEKFFKIAKKNLEQYLSGKGTLSWFHSLKHSDAVHQRWCTSQAKPSPKHSNT